MKLTCFLLLAGLLQVSARTVAQTRISLSLKGVTLEKAFAEIEKKSGYTVFYNTEVLRAATTLITLNVRDATIDDVLHQCLRGLPLEFTIQDKTVFVKREVRKTSVAGLGADGPKNPTPQAVSGVVKSVAGTPLAGATVYIPKLKKTIETDPAGEFVLRGVPDGEYEVVISFIGYEKFSTTISVANHEAWVDVQMKQGTNQLDETVVKGYYSTTNRFNTGDVSTVKAEDIDKQPVSDPMLALEGRVPGLYIQQSSGVPGANNTVRIRGQNSIANGNNPLYIVDGIPYNSASPTSTLIIGAVLGSVGDGRGASPFNDLNPADIERIDVLKDADATAIYGSRGANGVVLITTKKGKEGITQFTINAFSGVGKVARFVHFMNTQQYLQMRHEAFLNDGATPGIGDHDINGDWDTTRYTNWEKVLIGNTAKFSNIEGSLSGGSKNTQFRLATGYSNQGTVYPGSYSDQKAMFNANFTHFSIDQRLYFQLLSSYVYDFSNLPLVDLTTFASYAPDAPAIYKADGTLNWQPKNGAATFANPLANMLRKAIAKTNNLISNLEISYMLLPGLKVKSTFGFNHLLDNQSNQSPSASVAPPNNTLPSARSNNFATTDFSTWNIEPQIGYDRTILKGKFSALIGSTFQQSLNNSNGFLSSGFASDALIQDPVAATTKTFAGFINTLYHYDAVFGRLGYDWGDRYLINVTGRRDGSSRFGPGKQFGDFGAVGAAWIFSRERYIKDNFSFISYGKLRFSYGTTGNDQLADYQYLSTYTPYSPSYQGITGLYPTDLTNAKFAWELVKKVEGAVELGFLKDRILLTAAYYHNRTGNQLVGYPLPSLTGFASIQANLPAIVQNSGGEITLNTTNIKRQRFSWTSSFNVAIPRNRLIAYPNLSTSAYKYTYTIGKSLSSTYLFHFVGVNDSTGVFEYSTGKGSSDLPSFPQDIKPTKAITQQYYGGLENSFVYGGFQFSFLFQFVEQVGYSYLGAYSFIAGYYNANYPTAVLDRWRRPGDIAHYGRFSTVGNGDPNGYLSSSDFGIGNNSFIRLKNLAMSYQFPEHWVRDINIHDVNIYLQCQNLFTITHNYLGFDPENGRRTLPPLRMITFGLKVTL